MSPYRHHLENIIQAVEVNDAPAVANGLQTLIRMLGGTKSIADMSASAAFTYALALYLARGEGA